MASGSEGRMWGSKQASAASNKFKEGLLIKSKKMMALGVEMLVSSVEIALESDDTFGRLSGLSEFWNFITATEMSAERLRSMPKEFQSVLSSEKMVSAKGGQIPEDIKSILRKIKEIVQVGELLQGETVDNKENFVERSQEIVADCREELESLT